MLANSLLRVFLASCLEAIYAQLDFEWLVVIRTRCINWLSPMITNSDKFRK
jgi:hypothetical protein